MATIEANFTRRDKITIVIEARRGTHGMSQILDSLSKAALSINRRNTAFVQAGRLPTIRTAAHDLQLNMEGTAAMADLGSPTDTTLDMVLQGTTTRAATEGMETLSLRRRSHRTVPLRRVPDTHHTDQRMRRHPLTAISRLRISSRLHRMAATNLLLPHSQRTEGMVMVSRHLISRHLRRRDKVITIALCLCRRTYNRTATISGGDERREANLIDQIPRRTSFGWETRSTRSATRDMQSIQRQAELHAHQSITQTKEQKQCIFALRSHAAFVIPPIMSKCQSHIVRSSNGAETYTEHRRCDAVDGNLRIAFIAHAWGRLGGSINDHVVQALAAHLHEKRAYNVILMSARGTGKSTGSPSWT